MDLANPLADLVALRAEAVEDHNRGDEWATVAIRFIDELDKIYAAVEQRCHGKSDALYAIEGVLVALGYKAI